MEQIRNENVTKTEKKPSNFSAVRVSKETSKKLTKLLAKANKKDYGKRVKASELLDVSLDLLTDSHIKKIQENSLSNSDLLEMKYKEHIKKNGKISKDEFLGILLSQNNSNAA